MQPSESSDLDRWSSLLAHPINRLLSESKQELGIELRGGEGYNKEGGEIGGGEVEKMSSRANSYDRLNNLSTTMSPILKHSISPAPRSPQGSKDG